MVCLARQLTSNSGYFVHPMVGTAQVDLPPVETGLARLS
jgi:hypothetical protein